jgi:hypothetical protein
MGRLLQRESAFGELKYRSHQIDFVYHFALRKGDQGLSVRQLSRQFGYNGDRVKAALDNRLNGRKVRGQDCAFADHSEIEILKWVESQVEKYAPITRTDL